MRVLVTGGAGYIGSHTVIALLEKGHTPVIVDNLSNSSHEAIIRVQAITQTEIEFHGFDVCEYERLESLFQRNQFDAVIHFAGFKAVGESIANPLKYYRNNLDSTISLLRAMAETKNRAINKFVFSSSATVYGFPEKLPIAEDSPVGIGITNPYGETKYMCEEIIKSTTVASPKLQGISLRYFNPIGSHPSGLIGEDPHDTPNNLAPFITQVATGRLTELSIFGNDYDTFDGTGIRDYIHVMDLAEGHVKALEFNEPGFHAFNLGTGKGTSVLELVSEFEKVTGMKIPTKIVERRPGDIASSYADVSKAKSQLNWETLRSVSDACVDAWNWQEKNPHGYSSKAI